MLYCIAYKNNRWRAHIVFWRSCKRANCWNRSWKSSSIGFGSNIWYQDTS